MEGAEGAPGDQRGEFDGGRQRRVVAEAEAEGFLEGPQQWRGKFREGVQCDGALIDGRFVDVVLMGRVARVAGG